MRIQRILLLAVAVSLLVPLLAAPAAAWEFKLKGTVTYEFEMIGQSGRAGFFGPYDVDRSAGAHNYSSNFWPGLQPPGQAFAPSANAANGLGVTSSSDARWTTQYAEFFPKIVLNKAVDVEGSYYVGAWSDPLIAPGVGNIWDSEAVVKESAGAHTTMSPGYWNWLRLRAQMPIGIFTIGKRATAFGMGLVYDGYTSDSTSVSLMAPYGPLAIGLSFYPGRRSNHGNTFSPVQDDGSNIRRYQFAWAVNYSNGPLKCGFQVSHVNRWRPAERLAYVDPSTGLGNVNNAQLSSRERTDLETLAFLKYNNGRFFFNAEFDRYWRKQLQYPTAGQKAAPPQIYNDVEALVYGTEFGAMCGPAKLSFLFVNASDDDRRAVSGGTDVFKSNNYYAISGEYGNPFTVCRPYTYLMGFHYGGGVANGYDFVSGIGNLRGRWTAGTLYAARLDYAVASNLNLFFTGAKGVQWNKSYGWGYIGLNNANSTVNFGRRRAGNGNGALRSPAIPDDDLGWEFGTGFDWKLLEGFTLSLQYSYWQPGNWFKYACVSRTNPLWKTPTADTALWGTSPDRGIDAIYGLNVLIVGDF
jgi:hypothetical protein